MHSDWLQCLAIKIAVKYFSSKSKQIDVLMLSGVVYSEFVDHFAQ